MIVNLICFNFKLLLTSTVNRHISTPTWLTICCSNFGREYTNLDQFKSNSGNYVRVMSLSVCPWSAHDLQVQVEYNVFVKIVTTISATKWYGSKIPITPESLLFSWQLWALEHISRRRFIGCFTCQENWPESGKREMLLNLHKLQRVCDSWLTILLPCFLIPLR